MDANVPYINQQLLLERLYQLSNDLICVATADGYLKRVNPSFTRTLGWDEEYLLQHAFTDLIHPDDLKLANEILQQFPFGVHANNLTLRTKCKDGEYKYIEWVTTPEPQTGYLFAIGRDITKEREKEIQLQNSEKRFRAFFENSQGLMCTHDMEGIIFTVNAAGAAKIGYEPSELIGSSFAQIIHPKFRYLFPSYLQALKQTGKASGLMHMQHKDGSLLIWLFNNITEQDPDGNQYVIGNAVDITESHRMESNLKRTQQMLEQTSTVARIGAWELDVIHQKLSWSSMTKMLHGLPEDYEPVFSEALSFYPPEYRESIATAVQNAIDKGQSFDEEVQLKTSSGTIIWVRAIGTPEFEDGKCTRVFGTFQDINESALHREALKRAKFHAEQASIAKSEFLANMSHEIRTPLNGVIGFTDLVLKTSLDATQQQYLNIVNQSANTLLNIINDILDFSKIEAGKLDLDLERCDLFDLCSQAADMITYQAQTKELDLIVNIPESLPRFVQADGLRLKQILVNLLGNAVKFTEQGSVQLKVAPLEEQHGEHIKLRFEVRDTGIGIQKNQQSRIFEAFSQEDASTTKRYGGTGLGLAISNKLLALMGSQLQLESSPEQGSRFFFDLNLKTEQDDTVVGANTAAEPYITKSAALTILVVEDNLINKLLAKTIIRQIVPEATVLEAENGEEALALYDQANLILMDIQMPLMNGYEATRAIRARETVGRVPIIALTAGNVKGEKEKCLEAGMDDFVTKPFVKDTIAELFKTWL